MNKYSNEMCDYTVARCIFTNDQNEKIKPQQQREKQWICNAELFSFFVPFIFRVKVNTEQILFGFVIFAYFMWQRDEWRAKQREADAKQNSSNEQAKQKRWKNTRKPRLESDNE